MLFVYPDKNLHLDNEWVVLSSIQLNNDLHDLYQAACTETNQTDLFRYHANVPIMNALPVFQEYMLNKINGSSEVIYKIFSKRLNKKVGCASLMNIRPEHGVLEVGSLWLTQEAQRTEINTNALFLLFEYVFETLKYRRLEWKCNDQNETSKKAARRLGFEYEGTFRQHMLSRGENRNTTWFSMIDKEWPEKKLKLLLLLQPQ
jgi:RimJ/RimL family protein N-acetyltransferase